MHLCPRAPFLICAAAVLALSACGNSGSSTSSTASTPATTSSAPAPAPKSTGPSGAAGTVALTADPSGMLAFVQRSLQAKAGKVTIAFTNQSPVPHNVVVEKAGSPVGMTPVFSGATKTLTVALAKGSYTFYCSVDGHRAAGMQGTLSVN